MSIFTGYSSTNCAQIIISTAKWNRTTSVPRYKSICRCAGKICGITGLPEINYEKCEKTDCDCVFLFHVFHMKLGGWCLMPLRLLFALTSGEMFREIMCNVILKKLLSLNVMKSTWELPCEGNLSLLQNCVVSNYVTPYNLILQLLSGHIILFLMFH